MKKILLLTISLFTFGAFTTIAQDLKFAHVKSDSVFVNVESFNAITAEQMQLEKDYAEMYEIIQKQMIDIQAEAAAKQDSAGLSQFEIDMYSSDLEKKQYDLQKLESDTQYSLGILQQRMGELMLLYREAVATVATKMDITYVFDEFQQLMFAGPKSLDITKEVTAEMKRLDDEKKIHRYP